MISMNVTKKIKKFFDSRKGRGRVNAYIYILNSRTNVDRNLILFVVGRYDLDECPPKNKKFFDSRKGRGNAFS